MNKINKTSKGFTLIEIMVALGVLAIGVSGVAQLRHSAFEHISLTREIQQASYFADTHLATLRYERDVVIGVQTGEYTRGDKIPGYLWELNLVPLSDSALRPESPSLSKKVRPISADLTVWVDRGSRELRFHTLLLLEPLEDKDRSRPEFKLERQR